MIYRDPPPIPDWVSAKPQTMGVHAYARSRNYSDAIIQAFLTILSRVPDTLIERKNGRESARQVSQMAVEVIAQGGVFTAKGRAALRTMDKALRDKTHSLNPGTTADLTAAATFLNLFETSSGFSF